MNLLKILSAEQKLSRTQAIILVASGSVTVSFTGIIIRLIETATPFQISLYRAIGYLISLLLFLIWKYENKFFNTIKGIGSYGFLGSFLLGAAAITFVQALVNSPIAETTFILATMPIITAIMARIFLNETLSKQAIIAFFISFIGISLILFNDMRFDPSFGNLMAVITVFLFSSYTVIARYNRKIDMVPALLLASLFSGIFCFLLAYPQIMTISRDISLCLFMGSIITFFGNVSFVIGIRSLFAADTTFIMLLEFALAPLWVWLFLDEYFGLVTLFGGLLILFAVIGKSIIDIKQKAAF